VGRRGIASARITGLLLGFAGTVVVLAPWQAVPIPGSLAAQFACLLAAASYGVAYVYIDRFLRGREPPLVLAATQLVLAAVVLALITPFTALDPIALSREVVGSILALGALGTGAAYVLNYRLIVEEGATTASLTTYLLPIVSVVLGGLVLAEPVGWNLVAGAAIVLLGVALCERHITGRRWATIPMYVRPRRGPRRAPPARHRARPW
jgi:drug/metabolite transporter (DMT)-like permease